MKKFLLWMSGLQCGFSLCGFLYSTMINIITSIHLDRSWWVSGMFLGCFMTSFVMQKFADTRLDT